MAALHRAAFRNARPWSEAEFMALAQGTGSFVCGDRRCFALARVIAGEAELLTIATHPKWRRQGLARTVMLTWLQEAARRGASRAILEVASDNRSARRLYDGCGFTACGRRPGYYRRKDRAAVDAILMDRELAPAPGTES